MQLSSIIGEAEARKNMMKVQYYIGIDVGTGSARAGVLDSTGRLLVSSACDTELWRTDEYVVEQSSDDIWRACCEALKCAVRDSGIATDHIAGIGFCATASLVVLGRESEPVTVSFSGDHKRNVISWMDHRACEQAHRITQTNHKVLASLGGAMSLEMSPAKLLWIKGNLSDTWKAATKLFELPDYLTWRATGTDTRSLCTTVCKWTYQANQMSGKRFSGRWEDSFWRQIDLGEIVDDGYSRIGRDICLPGQSLGDGLSERAAKEMGLKRGTPVGAALIDGHAGALALLNAPINDSSIKTENCLAMICGTSSALFSVSEKPYFIPGIWGPYYSTLFPGFWVSEAGESATGALIDHIITSHTKGMQLVDEARKESTTAYALLNKHLEMISEKVGTLDFLTKNIHVLPYFHGNRSPRNNPILRGMISGLTLSDTLDDLALLYLATIQAIAYGTHHTISEMNIHGFNIDTIFASGGLAKNPIFLQQLANVTGYDIYLPNEPKSMLLGAAILGGIASGHLGFNKELILNAVSINRGPVKKSNHIKRFHESKYKTFLELFNSQIAFNNLMKQTKCVQVKST